MPWKECYKVSLRQEFVMLAMVEGANRAALCRRFGISPKTGYKWIERYQAEGVKDLSDRSRRPHGSPNRTADEIEKRVVALRHQHPAWGGRKIRARLLALGHHQVPASSTITDILHRHGLIDPEESSKHTAYERFEHPVPNDLWQMDFKGHFPMNVGGRCHPLTVLDDHSRFSIGLQACGNEQGQTVRNELTHMFRRYGLPKAMLMDNGTPWGVPGAEHLYTPLGAWLICLGIRVTHGRPYHPQTQGKDERFHRTLKVEVLRGRTFDDLSNCQRHFDQWRHVYNHERPHEALDMEVPSSRYHISPHSYPEVLPPIEYDINDDVRKVQNKGRISYKGTIYKVGKAFKGYPVALRPTSTDGVVDVYFCHQLIHRIDLRSGADTASVVASPASVRYAHSGRRSNHRRSGKT